MPLTNAQYDRIEREFGLRRMAAADDQERRWHEACRRVPELKSLEEELSDLTFSRARARVTGNAVTEAACAEKIRELRERRSRLLKDAGLPADALEPRYVCPLCRDTGYVDGEPCACRKKAVIELLYDQSAIRENLERENFSTFRMDFYDETLTDPATGETHRRMMEKNLEAARQFTQNFGKESQNLLLTGQAGTGKTFLSNCIAAELMNRAFSVLYLSASELFDALAKQTFDRRAEGAEETVDQVFSCDLLIIDDLGTEMPNSFVSSRLFTCINERILRGRSTLISTNLSMNDMLQIYSERVTSRLMGHYRILKFPDRDIRILKRMQKAATPGGNYEHL